MKAAPLCCVILVILALWFFMSKSSSMSSYYAPAQSSCSCNKPQSQGVYMPDMNAFPESSKPDKTYNYSW